jgi:hypothetical protein
MYQPGFDNGLAQIRYAEVLEEAAQQRAERHTQNTSSKPAARRLALALAVTAPIALWIVFTLAAH